MIPANDNIIESENIEFIRQPSKTWGLDLDKKRIKNNMIDGLDAVRQAIFLRLNTASGVYDIYNNAYGLPLSDLIGQSITEYVNIKNSITDTLIQDDRISDVNGFIFTLSKDDIHIQFNVTADGEIIKEEMTI